LDRWSCPANEIYSLPSTSYCSSHSPLPTVTGTFTVSIRFILLFQFLHGFLEFFSYVHVGHSRNSKYNYSKALKGCNANSYVLRIDRRPHDYGPILKRLGLQSLAGSQVTEPNDPTETFIERFTDCPEIPN